MARPACQTAPAGPLRQAAPRGDPAPNGASGPAHLVLLLSLLPCVRNGSGGTLAADQLAASGVRKLAAVVHKEAARTGEFIRLTRNHPEREFLVRKVSAGKFKRLGDIIRIDVNRRRGLVHPPGLKFLQAVLGDVVFCLPRAVVVGSHVGPYP